MIWSAACHLQRIHTRREQRAQRIDVLLVLPAKEVFGVEARNSSNLRRIADQIRTEYLEPPLGEVRSLEALKRFFEVRCRPGTVRPDPGMAVKCGDQRATAEFPHDLGISP